MNPISNLSRAPAPFFAADDVANVRHDPEDVRRRPALLLNPAADPATVVAAALARVERLRSMMLLLSTMGDSDGEFRPAAFAEAIEPQLDEIRQLLEHSVGLALPGVRPAAA